MPRWHSCHESAAVARLPFRSVSAYCLGMSSAAASRLLVLRHAHSSWAVPGQRDHQRPLDERGRRDAPRVGAAMARMGLGPDVVVCSTAVRATETLAAMRPHLGNGFADDSSDDLYALGVEAYFAAAKRHGNATCVLLIGHNPMVEEFTLALAPKGEPEALKTLRSGFPTAGVAVVDLPGPLADAEPGTGWLTALIHPKGLPED